MIGIFRGKDFLWSNKSDIKIKATGRVRKLRTCMGVYVHVCVCVCAYMFVHIGVPASHGDMPMYIQDHHARIQTRPSRLMLLVKTLQNQLYRHFRLVDVVLVDLVASSLSKMGTEYSQFAKTRNACKSASVNEVASPRL